jgi:hypothetical protein
MVLPEKGGLFGLKSPLLWGPKFGYSRIAWGLSTSPARPHNPNPLNFRREYDNEGDCQWLVKNDLPPGACGGYYSIVVTTLSVGVPDGFNISRFLVRIRWR